VLDALEAIMTRRSIRRYKEGKIPEETITTLLKAAMAAPSAHNKQPWRFIVVDDPNILSKVPEYHPYSKMLPNASHAIVVLGDTHVQETDFWVHDCSAATENLLIAAHALGLGAVWLGVHPHEDLIEETKKLFGVPDHVVPLCIVSLGYPQEPKPPRENYDPAKIHRNHW